MWLFILGGGTAGVGFAMGGPAVALIALAVPAVAALLGWGSLRSNRIVVTPHEIAVLGLFVRRRGQRVRAASVVRADVIQQRGGLIFDTVFVLDAAGAVVIRINANNYEPADIDLLVRSLGLPWNGPDAPVTAPQLSSVYPGMVPWYEAHPVQFAMAGTGAAVLFAVVLTILLQLSL
ncbi:hypothetical protein [Streptomyces sp. WAC 06738]|uniref:hypothetical protein n=1 Tax=Streptomyces sp. WAC 06738 TaxID=2203210 RepID=UPI000F78361A|nr:hypothetical protein [Streptomyces sp. WAC 06738]